MADSTQFRDVVAYVRHYYRNSGGLPIEGTTLTEIRTELERWGKHVPLKPLDEVVALYRPPQEEEPAPSATAEAHSADDEPERQSQKRAQVVPKTPEKPKEVEVAPVPAMPTLVPRTNAIQRGFRYNTYTTSWGPESHGAMGVKGTQVHFSRYGYAMLGSGYTLDLGKPRRGDAIVMAHHKRSGIGAVFRLPVIADRAAAFQEAVRQVGTNDQNGAQRDPDAKKVPPLLAYDRMNHPRCLYAYELSRLAQKFVSTELYTAGSSEISASLFLVAGRADHTLADAMPAPAQALIGAVQYASMQLEQVRMMRLDGEGRDVPSLTFIPAEGALRMAGQDVLRVGEGPRLDPAAILSGIEAGRKVEAGRLLPRSARYFVERYVVPVAVGRWAHDTMVLQERLEGLMSRVVVLKGAKRMEALVEIYRAWHGKLPVIPSKPSGAGETPQGSGEKGTPEAPQTGGMNGTPVVPPGASALNPPPVPLPSPPVMTPVVPNSLPFNRMTSVSPLRVF